MNLFWFKRSESTAYMNKHHKHDTCKLNNLITDLLSNMSYFLFQKDYENLNIRSFKRFFRIFTVLLKKKKKNIAETVFITVIFKAFNVLSLKKK